MVVPLPLEQDSEEKRADRAHVLEAVRSDGRALQFVSQELRGDREVVLEATKKILYVDFHLFFVCPCSSFVHCILASATLSRSHQDK